MLGIMVALRGKPSRYRDLSKRVRLSEIFISRMPITVWIKNPLDLSIRRNNRYNIVFHLTLFFKEKD